MSNPSTKDIVASAQARIASLPFSRVVEKQASLNNVTFVVKTFERPCCVARLLVSVRAHFPNVLVRVCDDSREPLFADGAQPSPNVFWHTLDFSLGHTLGAGRNHLISLTNTPYFFLLDDDHEVTAGTDVVRMVSFLERSGFDLVGGAQGTRAYGAATFSRIGPYVVQRFHAHHGAVEPGVVACDRTSNTFVARTEAVRKVGWEPNVYAGEHADFFLRAKEQGLRVAQMGGVHVAHDRSCEPSRGPLARIIGEWLPHRDGRYAALRRGDESFVLFPGRRARKLYAKHVLARHGVRDIIDVDLVWDKRALERLIGPIQS